MSNWFTCKINYLTQLDNGSVVKKTEQYMLNSLSFTEAEARLQGILEEYIPEYNLLACSKTNIADVIIDETQKHFFKLKVSYVSFDEDSGKERKINENFMIQADSLKEAYDKMEVRLQGSIVEWEIPNVAKTNIIDVFPYTDDVVVDEKEEETEEAEAE